MKRSLIFISSMLMTSAVMSQLLVDCRGTGPHVYLIGGGPAFTTWNLEPIQQQLQSRYKVCRWDMRGVGENAAIPIKQGTPVLSQWLQDMAAVLPKEPVILWGHSWGALQSLLFARRHPERVRALVLNNPVDPDLLSLEQIESKRFVHPYVESQLEIEDIDTPVEDRHRFRSKIASYFLDAEKGWVYSAQFNHGDTNNALNVRIWQEYRQMKLEQHDLKLLSAKLSSLIFCRQDVLMPESYAAYSSVVPAVKLYTINECAHFPWVEVPAEYFQILLQVLADIH